MELCIWFALRSRGWGLAFVLSQMMLRVSQTPLPFLSVQDLRTQILLLRQYIPGVLILTEGITKEIHDVMLLPAMPGNPMQGDGR